MSIHPSLLLVRLRLKSLSNSDVDFTNGTLSGVGIFQLYKPVKYQGKEYVVVMC